MMGGGGTEDGSMEEVRDHVGGEEMEFLMRFKGYTP
jgi:hypothetical protein